MTRAPIPVQHRRETLPDRAEPDEPDLYARRAPRDRSSDFRSSAQPRPARVCLSSSDSRRSVASISNK